MTDQNNKSKEQIKSVQALREEAVLAFWKEQHIFEKTLAKPAPHGEYVFYEGPPGANGVPMLHHFEARAFKDVIPRYKTMQGFHVDRRAGWDCHGLPVELQAEKELSLTSKKDIEIYGIAKYNAYCRQEVVRYIKDWELFTDRMGYWVDNDRAYYTMNNTFIESGWNIVAHAHERGYLYKDYKILPWCARCGTGLSSHELGQPGVYEDVKDLSITTKFRVASGQDEFFRSSSHFTQPDTQKFILSASLLVWTTTPWTLPGNVALAVGKDIEYILVKQFDEYFILAKERVMILTAEYEIVLEFKGSDLEGLEYEPVFPVLLEFSKNVDFQGLHRAFKVYTADFVTIDTGTGIVHIAPMYGADDFDLASKHSLPKYHIIDQTGTFVSSTGFLVATSMMTAEDRKLVNISILKYLQENNLFFSKENYLHPYPHCWRCKTPLIYYARDSWYFAMSRLREQLLARNATINWEPSHIKDGRFGEWLDGIRDWAISRERYWGTPLPVWENEHGDRLVVDSVDTLKKHAQKSGNRYFVIRHGQADHNLRSVWNCAIDSVSNLTSKGIEQVEHTAVACNENIDVIITSPFGRTMETAQIFAKAKDLTFPIDTDVRLKEWNVGSEFNDRPLDEYFALRNSSDDRYHFKGNDGESYLDVMSRAGDFIYDLEEKYKGKNILIVTHGGPARAIELVARGYTVDTLFESTRSYTNFDNAELREIAFAKLPHNDAFEVDLHRPYIDDVVLEKESTLYHRVREVIDVWFDSGAMPFAQSHYPFEHKEFIDTIGYPADFISEAIDQTRGWFYTLVAVATLFDKPAPFKNAICLGHLLDAKGQKMSKSKGNVINAWEQMHVFGADTVRFWMYSVTQPGDSKNYDEKVVKEMQQKIFGLLYNVLAFYELYRDQKIESEKLKVESHNVLDVWIMTRLNQFMTLVTDSLDTYKIFEAARGFRDFIDDLSTWYLRRSRDRIKLGDPTAKYTLYKVLKILAQLMAPFAPFAAEDIWQKLKTDDDVESVHLSDWPKSGEIDYEILRDMGKVREFCTLGNAERKKLNIPVRQPLSSILINDPDLKLNDPSYVELIKEELNIKQVLFGNPTGGELKNITIDKNVTPKLKAEGNYRELVRVVQDMRKVAGLEPSDPVTIIVSLQARPVVEPRMDDFKKTVQAKDVVFADNDGTEATIDEISFRIKIKK